MKTKNYCCYLVAATAFFAVSCKKENPDIPQNLPDPIQIELRASEQQILESDGAFAFDFFGRVFEAEAADKDANFMVSPLSLTIALAMTWNGSAGETKTAMEQTLKWDGYSDEDINGYYKKLKEALLKTDSSTKLSIANSIWTQKGRNIRPDFIGTNTDYYQSVVESVDFSDPNTVKRINQWACDHTNGLIKEVLPSTSADALMYLLNAIYFKGIWTSRFDAKHTREMPFVREDGTRDKAQMMQQSEEFNYTENETMQVVQLPYGNQAFSMLVMLPKEGKTLQDAVTLLGNKDAWKNVRIALSKAKVDLFLPKFKTEYSKILNEVLKDMGMEIAFTGAADFSRMSDVASFISFVKQDTYISTDELGTEAAAVTVVEMAMSMPTVPQTVTFKADHPFIYLIQENSTGAILFMGAVKHFK